MHAAQPSGEQDFLPIQASIRRVGAPIYLTVRRVSVVSKCLSPPAWSFPCNPATLPPTTSTDDRSSTGSANLARRSVGMEG